MMKYDYYKIKEARGDKPHLINKNDLAAKLGISRPTLNLWLGKYKRDVKLIRDNLSEYKDDDEKLQKDLFMLKEFIRTHIKVDGKELRNSKIMPLVSQWYTNEKAKFQAIGL